MKKTLVFLLHFYQRLSPLRHQFMMTFFGFSTSCRQKPSCSEYTILQIQKHGTITGLRKGFERIIRCHSFKNN